MIKFLFPLLFTLSAHAVVDPLPVEVVSGTLSISSMPAISLGPVSGTVNVANFPASQATTVSSGTITISNPVTSVTIAEMPAISGTISVSNFPAVQAIHGTIANTSFDVGNFPAIYPVLGTINVSNQITGFATEATLGSVLTATTSGTINVLARRERTFEALTVLAGNDGTLTMDIADGYAGLKVNLASSDFSTSDVFWTVSHNGTDYVALSCLNLDALDGQFLTNIGYWRDALFNTTDFACHVGGYQKLKFVITAGSANLTLTASLSKQPNMLFGIASNLFMLDYQWRTVGGDGYTPGPDGNAPTLANSKPIINVKIPLTANSPLRGTVGTSSAEHIAENADRKGLVISNDSANKIYLAFGTTAVSGYGIVVPAGGQFKMDAYSFSTQAVHAIATGTLSIMPYQEFQ